MNYASFINVDYCELSMMLVFYLLLVFMCLVLTAVFAGTETGFVSLNIQVLRQKAQAPNGECERSLLKIARQPERFLALTLIGINMSIVVATALWTEIMQQLGPVWVSIGTFILSIVIFIACELLPKMAFTSSPMELSLKYLPIISFADRILAVPVSLITFTTRWVMDRFGLRGDRKKRQISRDELLILLGLGASSGVIRDRPHKMVRGIIGLKDTHISEIMVPRLKIAAMDAALPLDRARKSARESGYSRIPIYEGSVDKIVGVVYFKDLFLKGDDAGTLRDLASPPVFVPEMKNAYELFRDMKARNIQAAVVLDEFGSTAGIVTLEDLIEEVVGEIHDELDEPPIGIRFHDDGSMIVRADINLSSFRNETGVSFSETEGFSTINGLILAYLGRIPTPGECLVIDGSKIEVVLADTKRVLSIRLIPSHDGHMK